MAALFVMFMLVVGGAFIFLQVVFPLLLNKPIFSWFRRETKLDKVREQFRVAKQDAVAEDAEDVLHDFLDDRIAQNNNQ